MLLTILNVCIALVILTDLQKIKLLCITREKMFHI